MVAIFQSHNVSDKFLERDASLMDIASITGVEGTFQVQQLPIFKLMIIQAEHWEHLRINCDN